MSMLSTLDSIEIMFVKFLCDSITAFGLPVVPDVKINDATEFDRIFAGRSALRFASSVSSGISKTSSKVQTLKFWLLDFGFWIPGSFDDESEEAKLPSFRRRGGGVSPAGWFSRRTATTSSK